MVQLSQPYLTTGKIIALTKWTLVTTVTSLLCNTLSKFVKALLPIIMSSDFMAAVTIHNDFRSQEEEISHYFQLFPFYLPWSNGAKCSHEIKRCLLLGRKVMTNLDSILKSRDITLPTKVRLVKAMVFPVVMYRCESWTIKKAEHRRIDAFELWCWRRLLRVPWTARRSNRSILKEISPGISLEGMMLKLKL